MNSRIKGFVYALVAAVSYGTNPLFSLPLYSEGLSTDSILFYRYLFAVVILGLVLKIKGKSLKIENSMILPLLFLGLIFSASSLLLYESFTCMDAGLACSILFVYPIMVALLLFIFYKEKTSVMTWICIVFALIGISLLYKGGEGAAVSTRGFILVLFSSLSYAVYMVAVNKTSMSSLPTAKLTFYCLLFGLLLYVFRLDFMTELQAIPSLKALVCILCMATIPTIISLACIALAIHNIGSTLTAVIGALEPVTALVIGISVFGEAITLRIALGVILILMAVTAIVVGEPLMRRLRYRFKTIRQGVFKIRS